MPTVDFCDNCGKQVRHNITAEPLVLRREKLVVLTSVVSWNHTSEPIICEVCVRRAAYDGEVEDEPQG